MLAADTAVERRIYRLAEVDGHLHQLAYTLLIQLSKRILLVDLCIIVSIQELTGIITREAEGHLCQIVGTEAEEISILSDLVSSQSCSRDLDHGTYFVLHINTCCSDLCISSLYNSLLNVLKLLYLANQRDHDLRNNLELRMILVYVDGSADNRLGLHLSDLRVGNGETAASVTHHRVELMERADDGLDVLNALALGISQLLDLLLCGRNELVKRRIQETDGNGVTLHSLEECLEISLLIRQDLVQSFLSLLNSIRADHLTEGLNSLRIEEHMLCTAKADTLCTQLTSLLSISRCICIGSDLKLSVLVSPAHDASELTGDLCINSRNHALINVSGSTVNGNEVALVEGLACQSELLVLLIHVNVAAAGYTALTHTTGNHSCVAGHTAANGQDTLCRLHAGDILRRCLQTNQNNLLASLMPLYSIISGEDNLTAGSTRRCTQALSERCSSLQCLLVELRVKQCIEVTRINHGNSLFLGSHALIYQIAGDLQSSLCGSLTVSGLQHVQLAVLNGKLHILHISVVRLQCLANLLEILEGLRELVGHLGNLHRCTNAGYHVLALCIGQELAEQTLAAGCRISCEGNTGTAVITHVTESHGLYVYSSTPGVRDIVVTTVNVGTGVVPGTEHGLDGAVQLLLRIIREVIADLCLVLSLELLSQLVKILSGQLYVKLNASLLLHLVDELLEILLAHLHYDVRIHLDESSVAVPCPTGIAGLLGDNLHHVLVETQVQDGIHHTRHGSPCTGTNRNEKRVLLVTELLAGDLFHLYDVLVDLTHDLIVDLTAVLIVLCAGLCCDGKALRYRKTDVGHLCQVCTLSSEKLTHVCVALCE